MDFSSNAHLGLRDVKTLAMRLNLAKKELKETEGLKPHTDVVKRRLTLLESKVTQLEAKLALATMNRFSGSPRNERPISSYHPIRPNAPPPPAPKKKGKKPKKKAKKAAAKHMENVVQQYVEKTLAKLYRTSGTKRTEPRDAALPFSLPIREDKSRPRSAVTRGRWQGVEGGVGSWESWEDRKERERGVSRLRRRPLIPDENPEIIEPWNDRMRAAYYAPPSNAVPSSTEDSVREVISIRKRPPAPRKDKPTRPLSASAFGSRGTIPFSLPIRTDKGRPRPKSAGAKTRTARVGGKKVDQKRVGEKESKRPTTTLGRHRDDILGDSHGGQYLDLDRPSDFISSLRSYQVSTTHHATFSTIQLTPDSNPLNLRKRPWHVPLLPIPLGPDGRPTAEALEAAARDMQRINPAGSVPSLNLRNARHLQAITLAKREASAEKEQQSEEDGEGEDAEEEDETEQQEGEDESGSPDAEEDFEYFEEEPCPESTDHFSSDPLIRRMSGVSRKSELSETNSIFNIYEKNLSKVQGGKVRGSFQKSSPQQGHKKGSGPDLNRGSSSQGVKSAPRGDKGMRGAKEGLSDLSGVEVDEDDGSEDDFDVEGYLDVPSHDDILEDNTGLLDEVTFVGHLSAATKAQRDSNQKKLKARRAATRHPPRPSPDRGASAGAVDKRDCHARGEKLKKNMSRPVTAVPTVESINQEEFIHLGSVKKTKSIRKHSAQVKATEGPSIPSWPLGCPPEGVSSHPPLDSQLPRPVTAGPSLLTRPHEVEVGRGASRRPDIEPEKETGIPEERRRLVEPEGKGGSMGSRDAFLLGSSPPQQSANPGEEINQDNIPTFPMLDPTPSTQGEDFIPPLPLRPRSRPLSAVPSRRRLSGSGRPQSAAGLV